VSRTVLVRYEAIDEDGQPVVGSLRAPSPDAAGALLRRHGLTLVRARRERDVLGPRLGRRLPDEDVAALARYVAITSRAGLPVVDGIEDFAREHPAPRTRRVLEQVVRAVRGGETLARAFETQGRAFGRDFLSMVRAGEASGTLETAMAGVSEQMRFRQDVRAQVRQALVQPAVLLAAVGGLVVLLVTFLLPRILTLLTESGAQLPAPTRLVLGLSAALQAHGVLLVSTLVAGVVGLRVLLRRQRGRELLERAALRLPAVGPILSMSAQARFVSGMATLLGAGVDAVTSLGLAAGATGSPRLEARLHAAGARVAGGSTLAEALQVIDDLHPLVRSMVRLGERSGALDESLDTAVGFFAAELPRRIKQGLALLEPLIIAVSGLLVAFILLAVLLPIVSLYDSL